MTSTQGGGPRFPNTVRVSLPTEFSPEELADFIVRADVVHAWLGAGAVLETVNEGLARLPRWDVIAGGSPLPERGVIYSSGWSRGVFELIVAFTSVQPSGVAFHVTPRPGGRSYLRIREGGLRAEQSRSASLRFWQGALNRLGDLLDAASRERRRSRQALVVVHGIGEQRPGQTLRSFVDALFPDVPDQRRRYYKPDYVSKLFELRTVSVPGDWQSRRPTTDVYELYWAHLIRDTTLSQVYGWLARLALAPNRRLPPILVGKVWALRVGVLVLAVALVGLGASGVMAAWASALALGVLAFVPSALWLFGRTAQRRFLLGFLGDAARYLEPLPGNILRRQEIRQAGADLLDALHDSGRYNRVIVYGHSLGSVIAYDILSHAWTRRSRIRQPGRETSSRRLLAVEDLLNPRNADDPQASAREIQDRQNAAWREYRRNGFEWRVSDFVTAGSPLAHARWLLNLDRRTSFDDLVADRSFPTSPPQTDLVSTPTPARTRQAFTFTHSYPDPSGRRSRSVLVPHFAGLFALTRWTNLYFPHEGIMKGDPVGGPLRDTFGEWIRDIPLSHPGGGLGGFAHNFYTQTRGDGAHVEALREALLLPTPLDLLDLSPVLLTRASGTSQSSLS